MGQELIILYPKKDINFLVAMAYVSSPDLSTRSKPSCPLSLPVPSHFLLFSHQHLVLLFLGPPTPDISHARSGVYSGELSSKFSLNCPLSFFWLIALVLGATLKQLPPY